MSLSKSAWVALLNGLILMGLTLSEYWGLIPFKLLLPYSWHKILHLVGVVLFMGNMMVGPVWFLFAYYSGDKGLLKFAGRLLSLTDLYFTIPGVALAVINGLFLAAAFGGTRQQPWLFYSILLMFLMWALSIPLVFLQEKIFHSIEAGDTEEPRFKKRIVQWGILGTLVSLPPALIFYLMVAKHF